MPILPWRHTKILSQPRGLTLLTDGRTIVVANGGIRTHPDSGRRPMNPGDMAPSLAYIDRRTGDLIDLQKLSLGYNRLSIRHLSVGAGGRVILGCQDKAADRGPRPLLYRHTRGRSIEQLPLSSQIIADMRGYVASVETDRSGERFAASCPRAGAVFVGDVATSQILARHRLENVFGLAPSRSPHNFLATSGNGDAAHLLSERTTRLPGAGSDVVAWDNHVAALF